MTNAAVSGMHPVRWLYDSQSTNRSIETQSQNIIWRDENIQSQKCLFFEFRHRLLPKTFWARIDRIWRRDDTLTDAVANATLAVVCDCQTSFQLTGLRLW